MTEQDIFTIYCDEINLAYESKAHNKSGVVMIAKILPILLPVSVWMSSHKSLSSKVYKSVSCSASARPIDANKW